MNKENTRAYKIEQIFAQNEKLEEIFMCSDDQAFSREDKAQAHARTLKDKKVENHKAPAVAEAPVSILDLSIKKLPEALEQVTHIEELNSLIDQENEKEAPRKGAVEALEARKAELVANLEVNE